jgi:regulatory protein
VARAVCLRLLTVQPRTRAELATALAKRAVPDDAAASVLGRFAEVGLIDDRAFAEAWVGSRHAGRGLARRALAAELRRRGVDGETVGEAVATLDPETEERTARQLVVKRLPGTRRLEPAVRVRRLVGMLARKGYSPALAVRVVREELAAEGVDPGELSDLDDTEPDA